MQVKLHHQLFLALSVVSSSAFAQSAELPAPPADAAIPAPACEQPAASAGLGADPPQIKRHQKAIDLYKKCMVDYAHAIGDQAQAYATFANKLTAAGNKAIADFNAFAEAVRKANEDD